MHYFSSWSTILLFKNFFKDFTNYRRKTNRAVVSSFRLFPNILKYRDHGWELPMYQLVCNNQLVYKKVQALKVLWNHHWNTIRTRHLWQIKVHYDLFNHLGSYRNIMQFQISSRRENSPKNPQSSRLEFLEKFSAILLYLMQKTDLWVIE